MDCYICMNNTEEKSPCRCRSNVHSACLNELRDIQKLYNLLCGICNEEYTDRCSEYYLINKIRGMDINGFNVWYDDIDDKINSRICEISDFMGPLFVMEDVSRDGVIVDADKIDDVHTDIRTITKWHKMNNEMITLINVGQNGELCGNPDSWERIIRVLGCNKRISSIVRNQNRFL